MNRSRLFLLMSVAILLLATALRLIDIHQSSLETDEVYTYQRTQGSLNDRFEDIAGPGNHVPLYFLAVAFLPHENDLTLRSWSWLFGILGIALFIKVTRALTHQPQLALWGGLFLAVTPFFVQFARIARPYPFVFFFGLLASFLFIRLMQGKRVWGLFTLASMAAYLSHYSTAALPISQFLILLIYRRRDYRFGIKWFIAQVIASSLTLLWILTYAKPKGSPNDWITVPNIGRPYYTITNTMVFYDAIPTWYFLIALPMLTAGLLAGMAFVWQQRQQMALVYFLILGFAPMVFVFIVSQFRPLYVERYFIVTSPAWFLLTLLGWQHLSRRYSWVIPTAPIIVITIAGGITYHELSTTRFIDFDWRTPCCMSTNTANPMITSFLMPHSKHYFGTITMKILAVKACLPMNKINYF